MMARPRQIRMSRAFTLVEALASMVVLSVLGSVSSFIVVESVDGYSDGVTSAQLHAEMSVALDRITREFRNIALDDTAPGVAPDIESINAGAIVWNDNSSLTRSGSDLEIVESGGAPGVLLGDVTVFSLQCYDESNVALPTIMVGNACDPIRRVEITMTCARNGRTQTLRGRVFLRATMSGAGS